MHVQTAEASSLTNLKHIEWTQNTEGFPSIFLSLVHAPSFTYMQNTSTHCIAYLHYIHTHTGYFEDITDILLSLHMYSRGSVSPHNSEKKQI